MKSLLTRVFSYVPTPIPVGMTKYTEWLESIERLAGPIADTDSIQWVICNEVMRLRSTSDKVAKAYLVRVLRKYAANQLAAVTVNNLKQKQAEAQAKLKQAEDTAKENTTNVETTQTN